MTTKDPNRINPQALSLGLILLVFGLLCLVGGAWIGGQIGYANGVAEQKDCR